MAPSLLFVNVELILVAEKLQKKKSYEILKQQVEPYIPVWDAVYQQYQVLHWVITKPSDKVIWKYYSVCKGSLLFV